MIASAASQRARSVFIYLAFLLLALCAICFTGHFAGAGHPRTSLLAEWLKESGLVSFAVAVAGLALASAIGYLISRSGSTRRNSGTGTALLVQLGPAAVLVALICAALVWLGMIKAFAFLFLFYLVTALPVCAWQMKRSFEAVPVILEEMAAVDGASAVQIFSQVLFPLGRRSFLMAGIFSLLAAWIEYIMAAWVPQSHGLFALPGTALGWEPASFTVSASLAAITVFLMLGWLLVGSSAPEAS